MRVLAPVEQAYRGINAARRALYRRGVLSSHRLPRPVVSVGNIIVGGAGKTPTTIALARQFRARSLRVCVLSRGHGRSDVSRIEIVDGDDARRFGDEPVTIATAVPDADVVVGRDRFAAGSWYLQTRDCDLFLLDDGFQHLQLARDFDVVVDAPGRYAREGRGALRFADAVVRRGSHQTLPADLASFDARLVPVALLRGGRRAPLETLRGERVVAFAALADNEQFFAMVEHCGAVVASRRAFRDHHAYSDTDVESLSALARKHGARLITTAKDAVKLPASVDVLDVEMEIDAIEQLVSLILRRCGIDR